MTILGLKIFRAGRVPGSCLCQYWILPSSLGGTSKQAGQSTADGLQAICSLALACLLAGLPGKASCLAETQSLVAVNRLCFNSTIAELLLVGSWLGTKAWGGKPREEKGDQEIHYLDLGVELSPLSAADSEVSMDWVFSFHV